MRELFSEYLNPTDEEKKKLWDSAVFVFDTNILLNLYKYSTKTRHDLLTAFESLNDRIWMPYHVGLEFMRNRCEAIFETVKNYNDVNEDSSNFLDNCKNKLLLKEEDIIDIKSNIEEWISNSKKNNLLVTDPNNDPILEKILELFNKKTGEPYSEELLSQIKERGKERYDNQIPPGYKDKNKCKNDSKVKNKVNDNNMYGDFIIWEEIMKYSKNTHQDIIFVTNDSKEDWWSIVSGKTLGPRYELRKEFASETKQKFYMYSMNRFIDIFSEDYSFEDNVIDEIKLVDKVINKDTEKRYVDSSNSTDDIERVIVSMVNMINQHPLSFSNSEVKEINDILEDITILKERVDEKKNRIEFIRETLPNITDEKDKEKELNDLTLLSYEVQYIESIYRGKIRELLNSTINSID